MRVELIRDWAGVRALAPEWNGMLRDSRADSLFLTWEWMSAWMDTAGAGCSPFVLAVRDRDGVLCGLAPLYFARYALLHVVPLRVLRVMADRATGAEYPDLIVRGDRESAALAALSQALHEQRGHWDSFWLPGVAGWTGARERLSAVCAQAGFSMNARPARFSSVPLPDSMEAFEGLLSDNRRSQFRSQRRKILARERATVTRCDSPDELDGYLDALFELHNKRRRLLGEEGTFSRLPEEARFYRAFAPLALARGWLRLYGLRQGGQLRAVQIGYLYGGRFHQMQEGFDPDCAAGAGNVLRLEVIRDCIAAGVREYDFLGGFTEHKRRWGAVPRHGHDLFIGRRGLANRVIFTGGVWPTGRYLQPIAA